MVKRALDIILSVFCIVVVLPLFPLIAFLIKLDSRGPVFYLCERIGKGGKPFRMYKFRTMVDAADCVGMSVCPQGDVRVTSFGRFLRRTKLNELPQLFNILRGEMSWVGPRPEAPDLAGLYPEEARVLFSVAPGILGPAQIYYRNEEELYPQGVDPKEYYIQHILPEKLQVDLEYVTRPTLSKDLKYILLAFKETLLGVLNEKHFFENQSQIYLFGLDVIAIVISYFIAAFIRFEGLVRSEAWPFLMKVLPVLLVIRIALFILFGLYGVVIRYLNFYNYVDILKAVTLSSFLTAAIVYLSGQGAFPRSLFIIDWFCINTLMILIRLPAKFVRDKLCRVEVNKKGKVLVFGAGDKGNAAITALKDRVSIIGFLDDSFSKRHKRVQQYPVLGGRYDIELISKIYPIDEVVIAVSNLDDENLNQIISLCHKASVRCSIFTTVVDSFPDRMRDDYLRSHKIAHRAGSQEIELDLAFVEKMLSGKDILVVGPSNVLGFELLKGLSCMNTGEITILDRYESHLNETFMRALAVVPAHKLHPQLYTGSLPEAVEKILSRSNRRSIVLHMGTRKFALNTKPDPVSLAEDNILNPCDLLQTVQSSRGQLFMMASAVGPSVSGNSIQASLRLAEQYIQGRAGASSTNAAAVRLFNVMENRGSAVHRILHQVREDKRVVLNHPDEERYFFTASSAAKFIWLSTALAVGSGGGGQGIFFPLMNGKAKVVDLARFIIKDYGLDPKRDLKIQFVASGNAQEWIDDMNLGGQETQETPYQNIRKILTPCVLSEDQIREEIEEFRRLVKTQDRPEIIRKIDASITRREESEDRIQNVIQLLKKQETMGSIA